MESAEITNFKECILDSNPITIRPISLQDLKLEYDFIENLSAETKHYRFFGAINHVSNKMLRTFCDVDGKSSMAFIATEQIQGKEVEIGVCRYVLTKKPGIHELALTIADQWQNKGLGKLLMNELIRYANSHGVKQLYSLELSENSFMRSLAKELGMQVKLDINDPHQVIYTLAL